MKSRLIKVLIALVVALAAAGGSSWQLNFNNDWREQYAYTKGVDALIYAFPYYLNTVLRYKWSQPEAPEGQQVPVDAVNKFGMRRLSIPKIIAMARPMPIRSTHRHGYTPKSSRSLLRYRRFRVIDFAIELAGFDSDNFAYISSASRQ